MISGRTRLAAVIGDPVRHSLSPAIHNAGFAALGLDWVYLALPVPAGDGARAVEAMRTFGIDGLSVTMPHKAVVAEAADALTPAADRLGVANCLFRNGDRIVGDSTDGDGFVRAFEADLGAGLEGANVLVVGAGGAARSVIEAVGRAGAAGITVMNRTPEKAEGAAALAPQAVVGAYGDAEATAAADVIVNTTAVGMAGGPDPGGIPVPIEGLHDGQRVVDIVYQPRVTPLLAAAGQRGAATADGVGMLVHQAALAFGHWTGLEAPVAAMAAAVDGSA
ncbi:MAG: shikimate dehydrogenase [Actinomycetota bacterium]